jgi:hypothetical protein
MSIGKNLLSSSWCVLLCCVLQINGQTRYNVKKVNDHVYIFTELWDANANGNFGVVIGR